MNLLISIIRVSSINEVKIYISFSYYNVIKFMCGCNFYTFGQHFGL